MQRFQKFAAVAAIVTAPAGAALAGTGDHDGGPGGLLSNVSGRNSSGHANLCGTGKIALLKDRTCVTKDGHHHGGDLTGPSGGTLSNLLFARNASGHGNNCGNETIAVVSRTTCVTK
ncbi:hypothetical protein DP939_04585 [Spongiactinospora rosea]|uniref:Secreted protein n=1 Tax=Spongiactinospora rosea TaxID=2248750 RepID=A0A366M903_9ACTN|nr:hypothetical protein [Spongiactinospora rosea]RBQ21952.1 hypothetical protein DP939_04585 [Spongiactinospora rosea]